MTTQYGPWVQTYTGRAFDLLDPQPEQIDVLDIAHALSNICRFTGHVRTFYSVAQHSYLVAEITAELWHAADQRPCPDVVRLGALLHDAPEAYIGDVSTPLKRALRGEGQVSEYDAIEKRITDAIDLRFQLFGSPDRLRSAAQVIKRADMIALATEHAALFVGPTPRPWGLELPQPWPYKIEPWAPAMAQAQFLQAFTFYGGYHIT